MIKQLKEQTEPRWVFCGIKDIKVCIYIHNIMHLYQSHTVQQNQSSISRRLLCSVLGIFYFSPFSATCTKSPYANGPILVSNDFEKLNN